MFWEEQRLEAEAAIAVFADAVVHTICADIGGAAFRALLPCCCFEPLLAIVGNCGEGILIVVEECFDDVHCIGSFYLLFGLSREDRTPGEIG